MGIEHVGEGEMAWRGREYREGEAWGAFARGTLACSGRAEEAEPAGEVKKRWVGKRQRAGEENECLRSTRTSGGGGVNNKVR